MRLYARKLTLAKVEQDEAQAFIEENHRQGAARTSFKVKSVGLYNDGELLAVAQFTTPRTAEKRRRYTVELLRMAFKGRVRIVGGASRLIKYYIAEYRPADIFTYQDTTGEATDVYEKAGMKLVSSSKTKSYLVAPGKTLTTATRKEALGLAYATRYGPDRILGTKLGEVFRANGVRKSNLELFLEELGWSVETTSGDRVYEWIDPSRTYYTYRLTASDSDKYYYGVSHVKKAVASLENCLNDGYFGSGGLAPTNKLRAWKKKHSSTLQKTVLSRFERAAEAYEAERRLIGELWRTDSNCLNSVEGGRSGGALARADITAVKVCPIHGPVAHNGSSCMTCAAQKRVNLQVCAVHGETKHNGDACVRCTNQAGVRTISCAIHGEVKTQNGECSRCEASARYTLATCEIHGTVLHEGENCVTCRNSAYVALAVCSVHGETKHIGGTCYRCSATSKLSLKECSIHGETPHLGGSCSRCTSAKRISQQMCSVHGETTFFGERCTVCENQSRVSKRDCPIHGLTKHQGDRCSRCTNSSLIAVRNCPVHGETKHRGKSCYRCVADKKRAKAATHANGS